MCGKFLKGFLVQQRKLGLKKPQNVLLYPKEAAQLSHNLYWNIWYMLCNSGAHLSSCWLHWYNRQTVSIMSFNRKKIYNLKRLWSHFTVRTKKKKQMCRCFLAVKANHFFLNKILILNIDTQVYKSGLIFPLIRMLQKAHVLISALVSN